MRTRTNLWTFDLDIRNKIVRSILGNSLQQQILRSFDTNPLWPEQADTKSTWRSEIISGINTRKDSCIELDILCPEAGNISAHPKRSVQSSWTTSLLPPRTAASVVFCLPSLAQRLSNPSDNYWWQDRSHRDSPRMLHSRTRATQLHLWVDHRFEEMSWFLWSSHRSKVLLWRNIWLNLR